MDFLLQIIELSGLPKDVVEKELLSMMAERGYDQHNLTPDNIREILATYMQDTLLGIKSNITQELET